MRTDRISHASARSCEGRASATTARRLHEENLYDRQPTERKHEEKRRGLYDPKQYKFICIAPLKTTGVDRSALQG